MSAPAGAQRDPRPSVVSMRTLLAAGVAATAVSTPPAREHAAPAGEPQDDGNGGHGGRGGHDGREEAAPESEAA
ncbi:hypothetical protein [Streptomyces sp. NBC_01294]|uniref:hypothetical protein n=1 Tax=Streptomyces sp. NBC_01294 TaxID=2903815 RepID=UPI002DDB160A|nr:hypothetical protein [Streptomyces sp. NBC_01294]WRZ57586.1 hypothetical protein OG534_14445 [Streptomyces sp. NBC_01294]